MRQVMPHRNNIGAERAACKTFLGPIRASRPERTRASRRPGPKFVYQLRNKSIKIKTLGLATATRRPASRNCKGWLTC